MGYSASALAKLAGVSTRALRFYEQKGLLCPKRRENGYREYGQEEVDRLQLILFFRRTGMAVADIAKLIERPEFDTKAALEERLKRLTEELEKTKKLIKNVRATIACLEGKRTMTDMEKFEGLKDKLIGENEAEYGAEVRKKYGKETAEAANKQFKGMTQAQFERAEVLTKEIAEGTKGGMEAADPACEAAQRACECHKEWLCLYWPEGYYSKEAHMGLAKMYVEDERFTAYYDKIAPGAAVFLRGALDIFWHRMR